MSRPATAVVIDVIVTSPAAAVAVTPTVPPFRAIALARLVAAWAAVVPTAKLRPMFSRGVRRQRENLVGGKALVVDFEGFARDRHSGKGRHEVKNVPELSAPSDEVVNTTKSLTQSFAETPNAYFAGYTSGAPTPPAPPMTLLQSRCICGPVAGVAFLSFRRL